MMTPKSANQRFRQMSLWDEVIAAAVATPSPFVGVYAETNFRNGTRMENSTLKALRRAHDQKQLNPQVKAATKRSFQRALNILIHGQENFSYAPLPYIVVPGDGGVIVEWAVGDNFVSANIDSLNRELDLIYVRQNGREDCKDFNYDTLDTFLTALFSGEEITVSISTDSAIRTASSPALLWEDLPGSDTTSFAY